MRRIWNFLLNIDEAFGNLLFTGIDKDETICAYCWRKQYRARVALLDAVFGKGHCESSHLSYEARKNESLSSH